MRIRYLMFCEFKQDNCTNSGKLYSVYAKGLITDRAVRNCFLRFSSGDTTLKDESRVERLSEYLLKAILEQKPRQSTRGITERLNISQSTVNLPPGEIRKN